MSDVARARPSRLTRSADFDRVFRQGRSVQHRHLVVYAFERPESADPDDPCRVGLTVSRRLGSAPARNRLKRQLREAIAQANVELPGRDLVVIARPGLPEAVEAQGFGWLVAEVAELVGQAARSASRRRSR